MIHNNPKQEKSACSFQFETGSGINITIENSRTHSSLLRRVKAYDDSGWRELVDTYGDRIYYMSLRSGMSSHDACDVTSEVFVAIVRKVRDFKHNPLDGGFRKWVRVITKNKIRDHWRKRRHLAQAIGGSSWQQNIGVLPLDEPSQSESSPYVLEQNDTGWIEEVRAEVSDRDWAMFEMLVMDHRLASEVAEEFGTSVNVVYLAKSRLLKRLRQHAGVDFVAGSPAKRD